MKTLITLLGIAAMLCSPISMDAKKKEKRNDIPQLADIPSAPIDEYRLHGGDVVLTGGLILPEELRQASEEDRNSALNMMSEKLNSNGSFVAYIRNYVLNTQDVRVIRYNKDCTLSTKLHVPYPMFVYIQPFGNIYLCPGDTVNIMFDPTKNTMKESLTIGGTGLSGEINRLMPEIRRKYCSEYSSYKITDARQIDTLMTWRDSQIARLDNIVTRMNEGLPELKGCSPLASDIIRTNIICWYLNLIVNSYRGTFAGEYDKEALWERYFDFLAPREKYLLDNPLQMNSADDIYFNRLEFYAFKALKPHILKTYPFDFNTETYKPLDSDSLPSLRRTYELGIKKTT